jgi:hypothetical protein
MSSSGFRTDPPPSRPPDLYYYRRTLRVRELLPAIGAGVVVGLAGYYVARILLQRTPLIRPAPTVPLDPAFRR